MKADKKDLNGSKRLKPLKTIKNGCKPLKMIKNSFKWLKTDENG